MANSTSSRSVMDGLDKGYSRSVLGGSDFDYSRSVLCESDEDYSRSVLGGSDEDYSRTVKRASDVVKENHCEPCQNEGNNTTAVRYCTYCSEYQCGPCSKQHIKFKAFRHHVVKDLEAAKPVINEDRMQIIDKSTDRLAKLDIISEQAQKRSGHVMSSSAAIRNVTANIVSTIDVSIGNESPHIYDLSVVQTHYCVVTDSNNKSVKVVDTRTRRVTSQIQITDAGNGWSITSVNDDQVAVSVEIKGVSKILLFSVSASGIISDTHKSLDAKYVYLGITHRSDLFYATAVSQIDVISMQGHIITTFTNKSFSDLRGIALSNDHNALYVCSFKNDTVFSVDLNGNVSAYYKDNDLKYPWGITVDSDGYVYVSCMGTRCVDQLTADLSKGQVIIKNVKMLMCRCAFNKNDSSLVVSSSENINVYSLTYH